jgi:adenine-specific DNA-methyltransferase
MDGKSLTPQELKLQQLKEILPEAFAEGKVDWEKLKATLGEDINFANERYVLNWAGKSEAFKVLQAPTTKTLVPDKKESVNYNETENIFIEGENLEVLKVLQKSYFGKVKMIYIDPPYNTGKDSFIYPDKFSETKAEYEKRVGDKDEEGYLTKDGMFRKNSKENGQYHSNWLNMMYPRLFLAKNLLKQDGVIFISIDDNEVDNLRLMMNEIFGEENFINLISVNMKNIAGASGGGEDIRLKKNIEYLLFYTKNYSELVSFNNVYDYIPIHELVQQYKDENKSWKYTSVLIEKGEKIHIGDTVDGDGNKIAIFKRLNPVFKSISQLKKEDNLTEEEVYKKYAKKIFQTAMPQSSIRPRVMKKVKELGVNNDFYSIEYIPKSGRNKGVKYEQFYKGSNFRLLAWLSDVSEVIDGILYKKELKGTYWDFASETKNLTKEGTVPYPNGKKPIALIKRMIEMTSSETKDDIILDFFAGSGSTAHAVFDINKADDGKRVSISVQLPELISEEDKKEYYSDENFNHIKTVADISILRLKNSIEKYQTEIKAKIKAKEKEIKELESQIDIEGKEEKIKYLKIEIEKLKNQDLGFKVLKLSDSNFKQWKQIQGNDAEALEKQMKLFVDPVSENATIENMVYELLLKSGKDLNSKLEYKENYYCVNDNELIFMLEKATQEIVNKVIAEKPQKVIALDRLFKDNDQLKTNTSLQMKDAGIEFKTI